MAQKDTGPMFDQDLVQRVIEWLQTRNPSIFPFTAGFDEARERAFVHDLRLGLSDLTETGAKRGTSASGYMVSDQRLQQAVEEWTTARGGWPEGAEPGVVDAEVGVLE